MKRLLAAMCAMMIVCLFCGSALADEQIVFDNAFMQEHGLCDSNGERLPILWADWSDETCYAYLMDMNIYTYSLSGEFQKLCTLPSGPSKLRVNDIRFGVSESMLADEEIAQLHEMVTHIAANDGKLIGYNVYSGSWGLIDADGIHWNEVQLDFSPLYHDAEKDRPIKILRSILYDQMLFVFASNRHEYDEYGNPLCLVFSVDLTTGSSRRFDVEGLCGLCRGTDEKLFCLLRQDGKYVIAALNIADGKLQPVDVAIDIPLTESVWEYGLGMGGLAYDAEKDALYLTQGEKVTRSLHGQQFVPTAKLSFNYDPEMEISTWTCAWVLPGGRYAILAGDDCMHTLG